MNETNETMNFQHLFISSCLEAEAINKRSTEIESDNDDSEGVELKGEVICIDDTRSVDAKRNFVGRSLILSANTKAIYKTTTKNHICTFCLMMTKTATATKKILSSTKRK